MYNKSDSDVVHLYFAGEVLIKHIVNIFKEYDLTEETVKENVLFISDRGSNIKFGLIKAGYIRLTCYAHIIHNLVSAILKEETVSAIIKKCTELCSYMKNSGLNKELKTTLKMCVSTRWNSVYIMINSIIDMYDAVYDLLLSRQRALNEMRLKQGRQPENSLTELVTSLCLADLVKIRDFLKPFKVKKIFCCKF